MKELRPEDICPRRARIGIIAHKFAPYAPPPRRNVGIRYRRPYNMRHSYATQMLMAGMNPAFCAAQLGHSVEIFLRTYSKWMHGDRDAAEMLRLESTIGSAGDVSTQPGVVR